MRQLHSGRVAWLVLEIEPERVALGKHHLAVAPELADTQLGTLKIEQHPNRNSVLHLE